ncbi:putative transporter YisQ [Insulibacter thermoxylanivorax]|uniref:Transporter YisQ n=1 Tax=Insulibacter thermoxylanivorax TaxID=2749268 RepID=A0A916VF92_9BACL|nr:MATE family efflux transporter [Insulibacter thermoxylanivorax]GFR37116.1 putative transporter YisQ [Insulibacter thermoxylanivorax]
MTALTKKQNTKNLTLFALTWPIFIEMSLHMLMGMVDTFMLSQYSDEAVAAVGVANQIINMTNILFNFVAMGTSILVAQAIGASDMDRAHRVAGTSLVLNLFIGIALSIILLLINEPALRLIGIEEALLPLGKSYLGIIGGFMFIQSLLLTMSAVLKSHGYTRDTMNITLVMNIISVIGNYIVIFGPFGLPVLGVTGVAIVTVICRIIALISMTVLLYRKVKLPFIREIFRPVKKLVVDLLKIGVPSASENLAFNLMNIVMTGFIATIGTAALVTRVYTMNLLWFVMLLSLSVGQGTQILVARMVGAGQIEPAYKRGLRSLYIGMTSSFIMAVIFNLIGEPLFRIFTDDPEVVALGLMILKISIILEAGRAFNIILIASLRAVGDVQFPVYMAIISMWGICVPLGYLLGLHFGLGLFGIFIAFTVDEWTRGLCMLWRWRRRKWMRDLLFRASQANNRASSADA